MSIDTVKLLSEVSQSMTKIQTTLESKILSGVKGNNPTNSDANAIENLKKNINDNLYGKAPGEVYTAFATKINDDLVNAKKITKFEKNDFKRTEQIYEAISSGMKSEKTTISLNGTDYSINYFIASFLGTGVSWADISYKDSAGSHSIKLNWTNVNNKSATQALAEYCSLLKDLDLELWKTFFQKVLTAGANQIWSVANYGTQIIDSINNKNSAKEFLKSLGISTKELAASKFGQFISDNVSGGDDIVSSAKLLKTLEKKQTALTTAVNNNKKIESKLKDFAKICNQLETKLGLQNSSFSIDEFIEPLDAVNKKKNITITGTKFDDKVSNWGENVTIKAGAGNDSINNHSYGENVKIFGENGNDTIETYGNKVTISGGNGNDNILNNFGYGTVSGSEVKISGDDGDDHITNYKGYKGTISGGNGNDSIWNSGYEVTISGGNGNDWILNSEGKEVTISSGNGNDSIWNYNGDEVIISCGNGDDSIKNDFGDYVTISGDNGNDSISSSGNEVTISGGNGNDSIENSGGKNVTISGGKGNDYISLNSWYMSSYENVIQYATGDGKDTVVGFHSDDTLQIMKGSYKVSTKNNDVIVKVGSGSITLKDAVGTEISIQDSKGNVTTKIYGSSSAQTAELFAENNFVTADNLSEIVKNDLTATDYKIETQNFENLTQKNNLIAFTDK